ncbi:MAG TPA: 16S rRNA (guanine(966)-N(2))-methyltransferase RsmD [Solirubrobacteraceae bacterium]|nr:16S rRNA (guanine(966)-N(2))-methyltransferase RsmD [Solirubrobacteraceae bacterium]
MRVIGGRYGGRRLRAPGGRTTRPTGERVREAVFSMLGDLRGMRALDLFAGSGALGIEALSRGAEQVVFVERDRHALSVLRANLASLELGEPRAIVRAQDAEPALRRARERRETYDLLLIDPPYRQASAWGAGLSASLPALLAPGARLVSESDRRAPLHLELPLRRERRYGDTLIRIHSQA